MKTVFCFQENAKMVCDKEKHQKIQRSPGGVSGLQTGNERKRDKNVEKTWKTVFVCRFSQPDAA